MKREWIFFWLVALIWGSSFLFMRIGVEELPPAQLAFTRVGIAAICMNLVLFFTRRRYPADRNTLLALILLGIVNTGLPFTLLAWGEQTVESGLTSVLQAITPVFALVIAHFAFADERITPIKIAGITLSFVGILVLTSKDFTGASSDLGGEIAILVASLCYGIGTNFSRRMLKERGLDTIVVATVTMTGAAICTFILMYTLPLLVGERAPVAYSSLSPEVLQLALVLGFFNTFIAYLMFYSVIAKLGGARSSMVTYVIPVVAITLGAIFLNEVIDARLIFGSVLILAGLALVNGWFKYLLNLPRLTETKATIPAES
ncbi:MAG TPA: EamA family transporter [Phototrophicaceae bacterium]|nr:EamA family transporter [Phototrophicaceae bacterium]